MIRKTINIDSYWKVIVYFNVNYNFFHVINEDLKEIGCSKKLIKDVHYNMSNYYAKAVTITNIYYKTSIVLFNKHKTVNDYINSIIHEAEHIKQSMLEAYDIKDEGEKPAYTVGYIGMKLIELFIL